MRGSGISPVTQVVGNLIQSRESRNEPKLVPAATASSPAAPEPGPSGSTGHGDCSIKVDGVTYLEIKHTCHIDTSGDLTTVNTETPGPVSYFAYITRNQNDGARIFWNSKDKYSTADEDLGEDFRAEGHCWVNAKASVCATL